MKSFIYQIFKLFVIILLLNSCASKKLYTEHLNYPKREFRGAWISTAWQSRYKDMSVDQMKQFFVNSLDQLHACGINAVIFQARPYADAFYFSDIEPWSAFLTGNQGISPKDNFDPLAFIIQEAHKRNMELHAWLNPYRVTSGDKDILAKSHIYHKYPERFVKYGTQIYFDPGLPENRYFICDVVKDIVQRYNVDAIHMDDYFYPYPIPGKEFPDDMSFKTYAKIQGFDIYQKDDWRRNNVNMLVKEVKHTIKSVKPWVRFGISPFGIYRNKKNTKDGSGSETNGLQNYDDLYADVKLWVKNGWIDYNVPQIYWEIGHKSADYVTLLEWWAENNYKKHLYIGQDVRRTMDAKTNSADNQLDQKIKLSRSFSTVFGNCFWSAYDLLDNYKGISNSLENNYNKYPALIPAYTHMHRKKPKTINKIKEIYTTSKHILEWTDGKTSSDHPNANYYVIYAFRKGEKINIENPKNIFAITRENSYLLPYEGGNKEYEFVITAVDVYHNESKGKSIKINL